MTLPRLRWPTVAAPASRRKQLLLLATAVFLIGVACSLAISRWAYEAIRESAQARFDTAASAATAQVERRFAAYVEVLAGLRALFHTREVSRDDFRRFTEALALKRDYPGFQVLNYAPYVAAASREAFEESVRRDPSWPAQARTAIDPPGIRDGYHPFTLIEPLAGNEQYLGQDIAAAPARRAALEVARDTGKLTSSGNLIQSRGQQKQAGLAMRMPVYRAGMPTDTLSQRRAAYLGSVGAGFLVAAMLADLPGVGQGVRVRLYEGGPEPIVGEAGDEPLPQADKLMFDTAASGGRPPRVEKGAAQPQTAGDGFRRVQSFTLADRIWVVEASAPFAESVRPLERRLPAIILVSGVVISASLAGVLLWLLRSRSWAAGRSAR